MKAMKKVFAMLLALVMVMGLSVTAFADNTYSITVTNTPSKTNVSIVDKTFNAYKIFDVSYADTNNDNTNDAFTYTISSNSDWFDAVMTYMGYTKGNGEDSGKWGKTENNTWTESAAPYTGGDLKLTPTTADTTVYVVETTSTTDSEGGTTSDFGDDKARDFADFLTNWLNTKNAVSTVISADGTGKGAEVENSSPEKESATISVSSPGYYLVTGTSVTTDGSTEAEKQTVVAAAALGTTDPKAEIELKAAAPTLDKVIVEGSDTKLGTSADVGDKIDFKLTSKVPDMTGYDSYTYIVTDTLSDGLTPYKTENSKDYINVSVTIDGTEYTNFTVAQAKDNDGNAIAGKFTITFDNFISQAGNAGKDIVITYSATLNENALTKDVETNTATLTYANDPYSTTTGTTPEEKVYVYDFDIIVDKYTGDDSNPNNPATRLAGAKFVLYKIVTENGSEKKLYYKYTKADTTNDTAANVSWVESIGDATVVTTDSTGEAKFQGLEEGTYYLRETEAPAGYNLLTEDVKVEIKADYKTDGQIKTGDGSSTNVSSTNNGQYSITSKVENKTGTELPSTGGIGTTIFYVIGTILVLGAAILLIVKKRMGSTKD